MLLVVCDAYNQNAFQLGSCVFASSTAKTSQPVSVVSLDDERRCSFLACCLCAFLPSLRSSFLPRLATATLLPHHILRCMRICVSLYYLHLFAAESRIKMSAALLSLKCFDRLATGSYTDFTIADSIVELMHPSLASCSRANEDLASGRILRELQPRAARPWHLAHQNVTRDERSAASLLGLT